jgi:hypothetical protein
METAAWDLECEPSGEGCAIEWHGPGGEVVVVGRREPGITMEDVNAAVRDYWAQVARIELAQAAPMLRWLEGNDQWRANRW